MSRTLLFPVPLLLTLLCGAPASGDEPSPFQSEASLTAEHTIDRVVLADLQKRGIAPARICSDCVFVRRVYLDVIGTLPTAAEVQAFLSDKAPNKRAALIDRVLDREEFADYWTLKWSNLLRIKGVAPIKMWPYAAAAYTRWVHCCIRADMPYDQFARELLTSRGSNTRCPPANFYRGLSNREPANIAQVVALTFMGERTENWAPARLDGMAAFFARIGYKPTLEWKEEIVFFDRSKTDAPASAVFPDGKRAALEADRDPRLVFAEWLIAPENPWFTRNIANRVWSWLQGRGIVHEPDDFRPNNPPSNPELLALLEKELIGAKYDLKHLYRFILNSQTYQLSSIRRSDKPEALAHFAAYPVRQLEAEVLNDALNRLGKAQGRYEDASPAPYTVFPSGTRAIQLGDASWSTAFLELFGRSESVSGRESERGNVPSGRQQLHLLNSKEMREKIIMRIGRGMPDLYLNVLSRYPTQAELKAVQAHVEMVKKEPKAAVSNPKAQPPDPTEDVVWSLINSAEFLNRH